MPERIFLRMEGDSMRPLIQPGDIVLALRCPPSELRIGDILVYKNETLCIHRLIRTKIKDNKPICITKGDNCSLPDNPWTEERLIGKVTIISRNGKIIYQDREAVNLISRVLAYLSHIESMAFRFASFIKKKIFWTREIGISPILHQVIHFPLKLFLKSLSKILSHRG